MVSALNRKLWRDLRRQRGQVLSIALLVACGVTTVVGMRSTFDSLRRALDGYYDSHRFGDVFAWVTRAPEPVARAIAEIQGVSAVQTRVTAPVSLMIPGLDGPAGGQLLSVAADAGGLEQNALYLFRGRHVSSDRDDEVVVSVRFAEANALQPGDTLGAIINGHRHRLRIVGIASAPDFLYEIAGNAFFVDARRFGILWMRRDALAAVADMEGAFNAVSVLLSPGASEQRVVADLDRLLGRYGGTGAVGRALHPSSQVLSDEMKQVKAIATVFPFFFLGIAAFLLNIVLSRLIATQRDEIGTLKAFGYSSIAVGWHYLAFAIAAVTLGAAIGIAGGIWLGSAFTGVYGDFFGFPNLVHRTRWSTAFVGIGVSGGAALAGAMWAVRGAVRLPPAEAMRPASPARYRRGLLDALGAGGVSPAVRMVVRTLERRPFRTAASILGIALASAVLVAGMYPFSAVEQLIETNFRLAQRDDLSVTFSQPRPARVRFELGSLGGVAAVELSRTTAGRVTRGASRRVITLVGLDAGSTLRRLVDAGGAAHALPRGGLVIGRLAADLLHVRLGDTLRLELLERGVVRPVPVVGIIDESIGLSAYMERRALNALLLEGDVANAAALALEPGMQSTVSAALRERPGVAGVSSRLGLIEYFERSFADSILVSGSIVIFAAVVIAVGVVYNGARISLAERARELASLRVLGFTRAEVSRFFLGEQGVITLAGLPIGAAVGLGFAFILAAAFGSERHRLPVVIGRGTYALAAGIVAATAIVVALAVRRRIDRLDLIAALKTGD
ncbi:MAG TPA: ABC transporter permease [Gemmatimonadaceae bacterium]|nr:ABC transporter permease [Gemmatimonadaceae bacterium]